MLPTLSDLENMAHQAGDILRTGYGKQHQIIHKGTIDLVTEIDHRSEDYLIKAIRERFPTHRIVTEESGNLPGESDFTWYLDPLDGTVNYAHDMPFFCVSIAFASGREVRLGAIYDPLRDECFSAEAGQGAFLNTRPIHVSKADKLVDCLMVTGFPYDMWSNPRNNLAYFSRFSLCTQGVRRLGSAALDLCYVAAGRLDGFWEITIKSYDIAAGALIVQEAGGVASNLDGEKDYLKPPCTILAANPTIHPLMLSMFREPIE